MPNLAKQHSLFQQNPELYADFLDFESKIQRLAKQMKLNLPQFEIDHLALRVNTEQTAKYWLTALLQYGRILSDNLVNGRVIYLLQLNQPLLFCGQKVDIIELPLPKNKYYPQETWEHIEVVMPFLLGETIPEWVSRIQNMFLWDKLSALQVKVSEPKVEGEQLANPSIAVSLVNQEINHTCIKVHPYNIKNIIEV